MFKLRLIKALSFHGIVTATVQNPIVETQDEAVMKKAVATGYFELIEHTADATDGVIEQKNTAFEKMTEKELALYAQEHGIDLTGLAKKADKLAKILEETAPTDGIDNFVNFDED